MVAVAAVVFTAVVAVVVDSTVVAAVAATTVAAAVDTIAPRAAVAAPTQAAATEVVRPPRDPITADAAARRWRAAGHMLEIVVPQEIAVLRETDPLEPLLPEQTASGIRSTARTETPVQRRDAIAPAIPSRNRVRLATAGPTAARLEVRAHPAPERQQARTRPILQRARIVKPASQTLVAP